MTLNFKSLSLKITKLEGGWKLAPPNASNKLARYVMLNRVKNKQKN